MNQMWGYTIEEISSMIRRPKGTVGRMLAEAKEMFRQKLL
jgi:DNA-directed RNA polymerase specialized sigma24 family protein